jgi:glycosyltransferase involved in cell wall biosynthesis
MSETIHFIDPTLADQTGCCSSLLNSIAGAAEGINLTVWGDRHVVDLRLPGNVRVVPHFHRRLRKAQLLLLYRRLLRRDETIFVNLAGRLDMAMIDLAARGKVPPGKAFLFFHWFRDSERKRASLRKIARRQPNLVVIGPTASTVAPFRECGFGNVHVAPYPVSGGAGPRAEKAVFRHLLFAGAARRDKGFHHVVDFVAHLAAIGRGIPFVVQMSPKHYNKYDAQIEEDIRRLGDIGYESLRKIYATLSEEEYAGVFSGGICLQFYRREDFADRVSGVTMDALLAGCPIVTLTDTWMARYVERYGAGIAIEQPSPDAILSSVTKIIAEYGHYSDMAGIAGENIREDNRAGRLVAIVTGKTV